MHENLNSMTIHKPWNFGCTAVLIGVSQAVQAQALSDNHLCDSGHSGITVESQFLKPPGETQIGLRNREFEKSKVVSNYA